MVYAHQAAEAAAALKFLPLGLPLGNGGGGGGRF